MPEPRAKSDGVKEDRRRPRNISSVSDNPVEIPDGCSMSTNTSVNILQYHDCQINAKRRKDQMHQCLYPSSIMAASHWFIQTTCLDDYQLSPKRFMIVSYITGIEHSTLGPLWKKSDFDRPLKSQVKPSEADGLLEFQRQSGSVHSGHEQLGGGLKRTHQVSVGILPICSSGEIYKLTSDLRPTYQSDVDTCVHSSLATAQETMRSPVWHDMTAFFLYSARAWNISCLFHIFKISVTVSP